MWKSLDAITLDCSMGCWAWQTFSVKASDICFPSGAMRGRRWTMNATLRCGSGGRWPDFPFLKFSDGFADIDGGHRLVEIVERWLAMGGAMVLLLQFRMVQICSNFLAEKQEFN
ncbi:hypothetical protein SLE2022_117590 [Rubroshorea leprosula]